MGFLPSQIQVLDRFQVSPGPGPAKPASFPLTFFDVVWLFTGPVERLFFYPFPHSTSHFTARFLPTLKSALSRALKDFYPLAGRVRQSPKVDGLYEIQCSDGDSIVLTLAECHADFQKLSGDQSREFSKVYSLVPQLPRFEDGAISLAAFQVTVFPSHGISVGVAIHHVACDDCTSVQFMKSWAAAAAASVGGGGGSAESPLFYPPSLDRTVIADPDGLYNKILTEMRGLVAAGTPPPPAIDLPELFIASFSIGRGQIEKLKQGVMAKASNSSTVHSSAFVVACAFAWVCLVKAQKGYYAGKKSAHLLFSVECRARLNPPVPVEYFGNCLRPCFVEVNMDDLVSDRGVFVAAEAIGKAIKGLENGVLKGAEGWLQKIISLAPHRPMSVAGSPKYRVYDTDFGWGRPIKVEMTSIEKTPGTVSLAESREEPGGIEIGLVLPKPEMDEFTSSFKNGLLMLY